MLDGSQEGRGDGGCHDHNKGRGAPWAESKDHPGKSCPFGNHTDARVMVTPEECEMY